jgi:hypothetical protein
MEVRVPRDGKEVRLDPRCGRRRLTGRQGRDKVDGGRAVVAEREADLTIVVV